MFEFLFLSLGIFVTSIFWWTHAPVPFEVPKVIFFQWFVRVLVLIFGVSFFLRKKIWKVNRKLLAPILIFAVWATITAIFGHDVAKSFAGNFYRDDGLVTFYTLIGFAILVSFIWQEKFKVIVSSTFFVSSTLLSLLALGEIAAHKFGLGFAATFGNPVFLAGYLAVSIPFTFYLFKSTGRKIYLIGLLTQWVTIILIGAISAILTLVIFAILYLCVIASFAKQSRSIKFVFISLLSLVFLSIVFFWGRSYIIENSKSLVAEGRVRIFQNIVRGGVKSPILGYGWANVDYAFEAGGWPMKFNNDVYVDKAHAEILEVFATTGIPGLVIYITFIIFLIKALISKFMKSKNKLWNFTLLSIVILYLFHSQTNVISIMEEIVFWLVVGITLFVNQ